MVLNLKVFYTVRLRACLHGGGGPQVGEVTRPAVVENWPAFTCKLTTPGSQGDVTRRCCVVARHVNRENDGRTTHFGGQCTFPLIICSRCNISVLWLFTFYFFYFGALANYLKRSFLYSGAQLWNNLPVDLRQASSLTDFKSKLSRHSFK